MEHHIYIYIYMYVCMYACMHACMYVYMYHILIHINGRYTINRIILTCGTSTHGIKAMLTIFIDDCFRHAMVACT